MVLGLGEGGVSGACTVQHCKVLLCGPGSREKVVLVGLAVQHCKVLLCGPGPRGGVSGACCTTLQSTALWSCSVTPPILQTAVK